MRDLEVHTREEAPPLPSDFDTKRQGLLTIAQAVQENQCTKNPWAFRMYDAAERLLDEGPSNWELCFNHLQKLEQLIRESQRHEAIADAGEELGVGVRERPSPLPDEELLQAGRKPGPAQAVLEALDTIFQNYAAHGLDGYLGEVKIGRIQTQVIDQIEAVFESTASAVGEITQEIKLEVAEHAPRAVVLTWEELTVLISQLETKYDPDIAQIHVLEKALIEHFYATVVSPSVQLFSKVEDMRLIDVLKERIPMHAIRYVSGCIVQMMLIRQYLDKLDELKTESQNAD
jgi:hypothetical protein